MTDHPDDPSLIALGAAVSDGAVVDWARIEEASAGEDRQQLVRAMREVALLVNAHRHVDLSLMPDPSSESRPRSWRHLVLFEPLGEGAFGTVYRGWDPRVEREVAVKLLRTKHGTAAPLTEAHHLARVRHSNVVVVHGADQDAEQAGIWMEYIDGQTLAAMVRDAGVMSAREATGIGIDLCRALSALHAAGLLHGDIKAHNVMREVGGRIVLMDFSGAQLRTPDRDVAVFSGTPLYMAPELFEGGAATPASDVYSLGVLLFFLLTGTVPVEGTDMASLRDAHRQLRRRRLRDLRSDLPEAIVHVIECATEHDPASRYRTIGELEHALTPASGLHALPTTAAHARGGLDAPAMARRNTRRILLWIAATVLAMLAATATTARWLAPALPPMVRFIIGPPQITGSWPRLSPDGRLIVFGTFADGHNRFWIRPLESKEGRILTSTVADETPFFSPDSRTLAYFTDGKLFKIPVDGGTAQMITDAVQPHGGDWSGDRILFAARAGVFTVAPDGTNLAAVTTLDEAAGDFQHGWPRFLSDGRRFLFIIRSARPERTGVYIGSLDGAAPTRLTTAYSRVTYAAGQLFWVRDGTLFAQPFDAGPGTLSGSPVALAGQIKYHALGDAAFDVVSSGALVYLPEPGAVSTRLALFDRHGRERQALTEAGGHRRPRFSPDGGRVVAENAPLGGGNVDLWVYDIARQSASRLTDDAASEIGPLWSTDGKRLLFSLRRDDRFHIFTQAVDGIDGAKPLELSPADAIAEHWSRDGDYVSMTIPRRGLWILPLRPGQKPWSVQLDPRPNLWQSEFSPDGKWIAYMSQQSGSPEVFVEPLPATSERWQVSTRGGGEPHWSGNGRELFYIAGDRMLMAIPVTVPGWQKTAKPKRVFQLPVPDVAGRSDYDVSADGETFVVNVFVAHPVVPPLDVVLNWTPLLKK